MGMNTNRQCDGLGGRRSARAVSQVTGFSSSRLGRSLAFPVMIFLAVAMLMVANVMAGSAPVVAKNGMVVSQEVVASTVGAKVLEGGGNAVDAAVATALALAVTHPTAGNIGGGGFLVFRTADGTAVTYDFREMAPAAAGPEMWLTDGKSVSYTHLTLPTTPYV